MGDILNKLQQMHELKVISQTSVEQYRNTMKPISQIGSELGVSYLLEGSVRKACDEIMITAQLINARDDRHVWADNFTSTYSTKGIFNIQREIAEKIVTKLQLKISPEKIAEITKPKTKNKNAYDHYLRGMFHWYQVTAQGLETALRYFELAREEDPNYAPAYAGIAMVWGGYIQHGLVSSEEASPKVKEAAAKALALDSSLAEVHYMLGSVMQNGWWEWNWEVAEREFKKTIELNPNFAEARLYYAHQLNIQGRPDEAKIQAEIAMEIEPFNPFIQVVYAMHCPFMV
jgi:tetratricopeptide (TPR) repeat protein